MIIRGPVVGIRSLSSESSVRCHPLTCVVEGGPHLQPTGAYHHCIPGLHRSQVVTFPVLHFFRWLVKYKEGHSPPLTVCTTLSIALILSTPSCRSKLHQSAKMRKSIVIISLTSMAIAAPAVQTLPIDEQLHGLEAANVDLLTRTIDDSHTVSKAEKRQLDDFPEIFFLGGLTERDEVHKRQLGGLLSGLLGGLLGGQQQQQNNPADGVTVDGVTGVTDTIAGLTGDLTGGAGGLLAG